jgi:hypothetical protein
MPDIYLLIEGQQQRPYTEDEVRQSLAEGLIPNDLPAWHEGLLEWVHVHPLNVISFAMSSLKPFLRWP